MHIVQCSTQCNQTVCKGEPPKFLPSFAEFEIIHPLNKVSVLSLASSVPQEIVQKHLCVFVEKEKKLFFSVTSLSSSLYFIIGELNELLL